MLSVCLIFLYMLVTTYLTGFLALTVIRRICFGKQRGEEPGTVCSRISSDGYMIAGLVFVTVYAQIFSLFGKVGLSANLLLLLICAVVLLFWRKELKEDIRIKKEGLSLGRAVCYLLLFLLFAYGTSRGIIHYDTGLYHAQSIRWMEEYGVVKGLGNLHCRLAYNSASFGLSAFYSFAFLGGRSFHCTAGFLALLLAKVCSRLADIRKRKRLLVSDMARIMGIYYLMVIFDEMISPASDYFMVLTVFYIMIRYLDLVESGEKGWFRYGLLALLCVYTVSIKLSAALIVLLAVKPAVMLIKEKNGKGILCFIVTGILIILPYFIRNVVISGWLVYPFTFLDFFAVDWKIPSGIAEYDAKEIQVWGRGIHDVTRYGEPITEWFGSWFRAQGSLDKLFILSGILSVPVAVAAWAAAVFRKKERQRDLMAAAVVSGLSFLFWLFSAPLIRYGCVYVWLTAPLTWGCLALWLFGDRQGEKGLAGTLWRMGYLLLGLAGCYKFAAFGKEVIQAYTPQYFICQKDYENFETKEYEIEGIVFYYPAEGDRTGYEAFPSSPVKAPIALRGTGLEDGFRYKIEK